MKNTAFKTLTALLCVLLLFGAFTGCGEKPADTQEARPLTGGGTMHEPEFGGVYIDMTIDDFNALGYAYGDSVNLTFSNGYALNDIPYYNGYYTRNGEPLLIAYPGYPYIKAAINNGDDLWEVAGLKEGDTAEITLASRGKYAAVQSARDIHYTDNRDDYESDEIFANFRSVKAGDIRDGRLLRSASPCDNQHKRASFVDTLMQENRVRFILNLSDNEEKLEAYIAEEDFNSPYFLSLYNSGSVTPISLNMNYGSEEFRKKLADGLIVLSEHKGPYLVHCTEGKDRTGFVCMLLEALCGASYNEIVADYMLTYDNYYGITQKTQASKYETIVSNVLDPMIESITGEDVDFRSASLSGYAEKYLLAGGMTGEQVASLKSSLIDWQ